MLEYTMHDLFRLTVAELLRLDFEMTNALSWLPQDCEQFTVATINRRLIRRELGRRDWLNKFTPG